MPNTTQSTVVAVFKTNSDAEAAASDLKASGFPASDIFISHDTATSSSVEPGTAYSDSGTQHHSGGIVGWFKSIFGENDETTTDRSYYEDAVSSGSVFLSVEVTDATIDKAADVLNRHSPVDVHEEGSTATSSSSTSSSMSGGPATGMGVTPPLAATTATSATAGESIPVVQEELQVGKRSVLRGGVRVYSRMVEVPVEESIRLQQETVRVERTPVNREATAAELQGGRDQVIEMKEFGEEAVVGKTARVVEEVRVNKEATERSETIRDTVRHTEVEVEHLGESDRSYGTAASYDDDFRSNFTSKYGSTGDTFDTYRPSYEYGYQMANDPKYRGRKFSDVESELKSDYATRYPNSTWDKMKDSVSYGWNKLTNKT